MSGPILVVVEDDTLRHSLRDWLALVFAQYTIIEAPGEDALRLCRAQPPQMILIDVDTSGRDGVDLLHRLKATVPSVDILALALHNYAALREAIEAAGASAIALKGSLDKEFIKAVAAFLKPNTEQSSSKNEACVERKPTIVERLER